MTIEQEWLQYREIIRAHIAKHGRSIQPVGETESGVRGKSFSYTIGNYELGPPELLISTRTAVGLTRPAVTHRTVINRFYPAAARALVADYSGTKIPRSSIVRHMPASPACGYQVVAAIASINCRASFGATASVAFAAAKRTSIFE